MEDESWWPDLRPFSGSSEALKAMLPDPQPPLLYTQNILEATSEHRVIRSDCGFVCCSESIRPEKSFSSLWDSYKRLIRTEVLHSLLLPYWLCDGLCSGLLLRFIHHSVLVSQSKTSKMGSLHPTWVLDSLISGQNMPKLFWINQTHSWTDSTKSLCSFSLSFFKSTMFNSTHFFFVVVVWFRFFLLYK